VYDVTKFINDHPGESLSCSRRFDPFERAQTLPSLLSIADSLSFSRSLLIATGGDDVLMPFAGKDITLAMADEDSHVHSKSAYQMMNEVSLRARFPRSLSSSFSPSPSLPQVADSLALLCSPSLQFVVGRVVIADKIVDDGEFPPGSRKRESSTSSTFLRGRRGRAQRATTPSSLYLLSLLSRANLASFCSLSCARSDWEATEDFVSL